MREVNGKIYRNIPEQVEYLTEEWRKLGKKIELIRAEINDNKIINVNKIEKEEKKMTKHTIYEVIKHAEELGFDPFYQNKLRAKKLMREMAAEEKFDLPEYVWHEIDERIDSFESDKISEFDLVQLLDDVYYEFDGVEHFSYYLEEAKK